jgi:hypothetical protein
MCCLWSGHGYSGQISESGGHAEDSTATDPLHRARRATRAVASPMRLEVTVPYLPAPQPPRAPGPPRLWPPRRPHYTSWRASWPRPLPRRPAASNSYRRVALRLWWPVWRCARPLKPPPTIPLPATQSSSRLPAPIVISWARKTSTGTLVVVPKDHLGGRKASDQNRYSATGCRRTKVAALSGSTIRPAHLRQRHAPTGYRQRAGDARRQQ